MPAQHQVTRVRRIAVLLYGLGSYLVFLATFVYLVGFVTGIAVPRSVDRCRRSPNGTVDHRRHPHCSSCSPLQHSVMARPAFKRWWTRYAPVPIERSTYVPALQCGAGAGVLRSGGRSKSPFGPVG